ncbi:MAG: DUF309 domain-containing protein [Anaerolineales bacterium]|nr:DUF309 domain-containing protein [Anaerolineales bacterium]
MTTTTQTPLIIGFVADLMFTTRIEAAAHHAGFRIHWIENAATIGTIDINAPNETPGERLHGRSGQLFTQITAWQPALLLFDLTNTAVPWQAWIPLLKSSPATRRIPILCFGPHQDVELMQTARRVGADHVLARSRFTANMPQLLQQIARIPDYDAIVNACAQPLPELARRGIALFNQGDYYQCHDDLEEIWRQDNAPGRELYQGILQVGIALYQIQRGNYRGAVKMLLRVRQWLAPLPAVCRGVDVARLRANVETYYESLQGLTAVTLTEFDWSQVEPILVQEG